MDRPLKLLRLLAQPRKPDRIALPRRCDNLSRKGARILAAFAEAALGGDVAERVPDLIGRVDAALDYQSQRTVAAVERTLVALETVDSPGLTGFSRRSPARRVAVLAELRASADVERRAAVTRLTQLVAAVFYAAPATRSEVGYLGPTVETPSLTAAPPYRWRGDDDQIPLDIAATPHDGD